MRKNFNKSDPEAQNYALRYLDSQLVDYMRFDINFIAPICPTIEGERHLWIFAKKRDQIIIADNPKDIENEFLGLWWCKAAFPKIVQMFKFGATPQYLQLATCYIENRKQSEYEFLFPAKYFAKQNEFYDKFYAEQLAKIGEERRKKLFDSIDEYSDSSKWRELFK